MAKKIFDNPERNKKRYEAVAQGICLMMSANSTGPNDDEQPVLDFTPPHQWGEDVDPPMTRALQNHLNSLFQSLNWADPRTVEKFYVEMRCWADEQLEAHHKHMDALDFQFVITQPSQNAQSSSIH